MTRRLDPRRSRLVSSLLTPGLVLAVALMVGRLSGLARETIIASRYGLTVEGDFAIVITTIPDLLVNLIISGGLSAALVPRLTQLNAAEANQLWRTVAVMTLVFFSVFAGIFAFAPLTVLSPLMPGHHTAISGIDAAVTLPVALSIPLAALAGLTGAYLNAANRFLVAGLGTLMFNLGLIATLMFMFDQQHFSLMPLAAGVLVGAVVRVAPQIAVLPPSLLSHRSFASITRNGFAKQFFSGVASVTLMLLAPVLLRSAASLYEPGTLAAFNYAQKLTELPVGVLFAAINTVFLTRVSLSLRDGKLLEAHKSTTAALRLSISIAGLLAIGGIGFSRDIVSLVFGYGRMTASDQDAVASLFRISALSLPFTAAALVAISYLNASGRTAAVFRKTLIALVILPVFAVWAASMADSAGLMIAFVAFQASLAFLMLHGSGILTLSGGSDLIRNFIDWRFLKLLVLSWTPIMLAALFSNQFDGIGFAFRIVLAASGAILGLAIVLVGARIDS
jgi:putative peptidoglycan lipid II flippase